MASKAPPPSTHKPSGVPSSGSGLYIVAAILLVIAIGAAIAWKTCGSTPPPPPPPPDAAPPPSSKLRDDDVPLPPPIEDAGPDAGKKVIVTYVNNQCDAKKCAGQSGTDLENALAFRVKQAHRCYDNQLAQDPTLRGKVTIAVRVGATGQVCSAGVASNDMSTPQVANCVTGYFRGANFPAPKGGCADINIPINYKPRE
jgi:hypothetical protein